MFKDSEQLKKLLNSFSNAEERVNKILFGANTGTVQQLKMRFNKELKTVEMELEEQTQKWAKNDLKEAYEEGAQKIGNLPTGRLDSQIKQEKILNPYIELTSTIKKATTETRENINSIINNSYKNGVASIKDIKNTIQEEMAKQTSSLSVTYSNGAKVSLSAYSNMLARTARIETSNTGSLARCEAMDIDLVRCTTVPNCCSYCKKYEGKVYSISGNDKRFTSLYGPDSPFQNGYNIMHPNCRHEFLPFIEELQPKQELQNIIKDSNEFTNYSKDDKIFKVYNAQQAKLRQYRQEDIEYYQLKNELGNKFPYNTLGAFRRGKRADSETYLKLKKNN